MQDFFPPIISFRIRWVAQEYYFLLHVRVDGIEMKSHRGCTNEYFSFLWEHKLQSAWSVNVNFKKLGMIHVLYLYSVESSIQSSSEKSLLFPFNWSLVILLDIPLVIPLLMHENTKKKAQKNHRQHISAISIRTFEMAKIWNDRHRNARHTCGS